MPINLYQVGELPPDETAALGDLNAAVYPPAENANWPGNSIQWAQAQWRVIGWDEQGSGNQIRAITHVGVVLREGKLNDEAVKIGGIGGVMTHPDHRRQHWAAKCIARAVEFFDQQAVDFGLLVCKPELVQVYERMGWQPFADPLFVTQHGQHCQFTFNLPMIRPVRRHDAIRGPIDLLGPPW